MTAPDIATLRQLLADATPRPWEIPESIHGDPYITEQARGFLRGGGIAVCDRRDDYGRSNATLIVGAVNELEGLLDRVEAAVAQLRGIVHSPEANQFRNDACFGRVDQPYANNRYVRLLDDVRAALVGPIEGDEG